MVLARIDMVWYWYTIGMVLVCGIGMVLVWHWYRGRIGMILVIVLVWYCYWYSIGIVQRNGIGMVAEWYLYVVLRFWYGGGLVLI